MVGVFVYYVFGFFFFYGYYFDFIFVFLWKMSGKSQIPLPFFQTTGKSWLPSTRLQRGHENLRVNKALVLSQCFGGISLRPHASWQEDYESVSVCHSSMSFNDVKDFFFFFFCLNVSHHSIYQRDFRRCGFAVCTCTSTSEEASFQRLTLKYHFPLSIGAVGNTASCNCFVGLLCKGMNICNIYWVCAHCPPPQPPAWIELK